MLGRDYLSMGCSGKHPSWLVRTVRLAAHILPEPWPPRANLTGWFFIQLPMDNDRPAPIARSLLPIAAPNRPLIVRSLAGQR